MILKVAWKDFPFSRFVATHTSQGNHSYEKRLERGL